jgi:hypothetical protein
MSQLGKRYRCEECGTEILCTKAGEEELNWLIKNPSALPVDSLCIEMH